MDIAALYEIYQRSTGICTDSRKLQAGNFFVALKGERFNGNLFAAKALEQGAIACLIDEAIDSDSQMAFRVDDALECLQEIATYHRKRLKIPWIAITGSNGKTTTKELLYSVLSTQFQTYATEGNLNNHIGVPLTVLKVPSHAEMAIIEMGANHQLEINQLCKVALPNFGLITNIGRAHLEGFGGPEGVKAGKGELFEFLEPFGGRAFVNMNDSNVSDLAYFMDKVSTYGTGKFFSVNGSAVEHSDPLIVRWWEKDRRDRKAEPVEHLIKTQLTGAYNLDNVLAVIAVALKFEVSAANIILGIENYQPQNQRSQVIHWKEQTVILDCYNANPSSVVAALKNLDQKKGDQKIAIIGDMLELGEYSEEEHKQIAKQLLQMNLLHAVIVGPEFSKLEGEGLLHFPSANEAKKWLAGQALNNATILIKGSRGMRMEKIIS